MSEVEPQPESEKKESIPVPEQAPPVAKRSFVPTEEEMKKAELKKEVGKESKEIPPAEMTLMYCANELKKLNAKMDTLISFFQDATAKINAQKTAELKGVREAPTPTTPEPPTPTPKTQIPETSPRLAEVKLKLGEMVNLLKFDETESAQYIKISPRQFLGAENFAKIASIIKNELGGQYVSQGKNSHFLIPKAKA